MDLPILLIIIIVLALIFDYINGFHDAANSIATIVSTKVLTPFQAVVWAAVWNFAAFFIAAYVIGEFKIGNTIAKSVNVDFINLEVIFAGLIAAIAWNLLTWWFGIPSSSSHTLIGGFLGAALMYALVQDYHVVALAQPDLSTIDKLSLAFKQLFTQNVVKYEKVVPIFLFIFMAPLIGSVISIIITLFIVNVSKKTSPRKADNVFKKLQLFSSALFSLGHGLNDAQKVMGIIGAAVIFHHTKTLQDPAYLTLDSSHQFNYFVDHYFGIPVSTTHTITGAIIGVGVTKRVSAVRWGITISLLWAWILTIPISAFVAGVTYLLVVFLR